MPISVRESYQIRISTATGNFSVKYYDHHEHFRMYARIPLFTFIFYSSLMLSFATARKLKARIIGADAEKATSDSVITDLKAASVPISSADCRICPDPCDEGISVYPFRFFLSNTYAGHDDWPPRFDVDMETFMLGSVKPYQRQVSRWFWS